MSSPRQKIHTNHHPNQQAYALGSQDQSKGHDYHYA